MNPRQYRLLIVDDNEMNRDMLARRLSRSGYVVVKALRKDYSPSQLPIIMVTARNQREDIIRALNLGANDYLTKPIDFPVALARIGSQLSRKREEVSDQPATKSDLPDRGYTPRYSF